MAAPAFIANSQLVIAHFGCWPSFHDAKVVAYEAPSEEASSLGFTLHTWTMTSEVDSKGFFTRKDHALVTFRFTGLSDVAMEHFASGNILFGVEFEERRGGPGLRVELDSVMDMPGFFAADAGEILAVVPCGSDGKSA